jgi:hypothetical protein|tara:strand:+ start:381 stop:1010 length:630 start_codon:yes stop_codon:yes gene_type:complete
VDRLVLVPLKLKGRYFILHAAGNAIAVILTFNGMTRTLLDPVHAAEGDVQIFGYCVVVAIHLYHVLAFRPLPQVEWVHHVLMIGIVGPVVFYYARGAIIDYCSFFLSGLPGGIDYVMLALVKNGTTTTGCSHMYHGLHPYVLSVATLCNEAATPALRLVPPPAQASLPGRRRSASTAASTPGCERPLVWSERTSSSKWRCTRASTSVRS